MIPTLDIILVNRNTGSMLSECIHSIATTRKESFHLGRVVIVDDMSTDDSLNSLGGPSLPLVVLKNRQRSGYGASCNSGAAGSTADFLLFLNTDTRLEADSINVPLEFIAKPENRVFQLVGIKMVNARDAVARTCSRFPTSGTLLNSMLGLDRFWPRVFPGPTMREWDHLDSKPVDQVVGAFLLINRKLFQDLNGYDERFFVYYEDLDLSLRASKLGFKSMYLADVFAHHREGGTSRKSWAESLLFNRQSRIKYARKHFGPVAALSVAVVTLAVEPFVRSVYALTGGSSAELAANWSATWRLWRSYFTTAGSGTRSAP